MIGASVSLKNARLLLIETQELLMNDKAKQNQTEMASICREDGTILSNQDEIEMEILGFYGNLMGKANEELIGIDLVVMRGGPQLINDQRSMPVRPISEHEILQALKGIGDLKAPGVDGFGAKFFNVSWHIIKQDVIAAVMEFFNHNRMYPTINSTLVSLIPKGNADKNVKDFRLIS
ncbi:hypothetical protein KIW84_072053 [Lathyrus oleraceus]|uniref:Reverse transcriptase n=1 Tax=Pisum sativum TaxID=3888 RepID=A0A9D4VK94_PEA|nr:hypothetical protein KIW84_072053 [Pisum sativum]